MAVTLIWRVKGWLGKVVIYIENPEKTTNPEYYQSDAITDRQCQGLEDVISYAVNSQKTQQATEDADIMERYVSGVNCHPSTARDEMLAVKKHFGKEDGTIAYHGYQSFAPGEATPELVHKIGVELAQQLWGNKYQVVVATHLDKSNQQNRKRLHFLLREDLIKLETITQEARLLGTHRIDTAQQLSSYKGGLEAQIDQLTAQRKFLYKKQRSVAVKSDEGKAAEVKDSITKLSSQLATLRREVKLCNDIALRSGIILKHIQMEQAKEQSVRKEKTEHEQRRRCSGTNR